jgi:hypothetical protein
MLELHDSRTGLRYVWNESHTVSIYNREGEEIDCFTFGFMADGSRPTFVEFCAAVNRRMTEYV